MTLGRVLHLPTHPVPQRNEAEASSRWQDVAACLGMDPEIFFPQTHGNDYAHARVACNSCTVRGPCLNDAVDKQDYSAFRAGLTPVELKAFGRRKRAAQRGGPSTCR